MRVFPLDIAETKANQVVEFARINQHPQNVRYKGNRMISEELEIRIQKAFELARLKKHEFLTLEHLMLELCKDEEVIKLFLFYKIDVKKISDDLQHFIDKKLKDIIVKDDSRPTPSASFERVLKRSSTACTKLWKKRSKSS